MVEKPPPGGNVSAISIEGLCFQVGTPARLEAAERDFYPES